MSIPASQRAWRILRRGQPSQALELREDTPVLTDLEDGEVLVKIKAAALNPVGYKLMGLLPSFFAVRPLTAEYDFSGVVLQQKSSSFQVGDEVFGQMPARGSYPSKGQGALAEYITIAGRQLCHKPDTLSFEEAAGIALTARTAIDALVDLAKIQEGQKVLINGGSSAVGIFGIQIAKAYGCSVTATCSSRNVDLVRKLGADAVIDYTSSPPERCLVEHPPEPKFDVIFDCVAMSASLYGNSEAYLKPEGLFVTVVPGALGGGATVSNVFCTAKSLLLPGVLGGAKRRHELCATRPDGRAVPLLDKLVNEGKLKPIIDSVYSFQDVLKAYERMMSGRASGKIIVKIEPQTGIAYCDRAW